MDRFKKYLSTLRPYLLAIIVCAGVTGLFIVQRQIYFSWDFNAYVLNSEYWFQGGEYFEHTRPPIVPFMLGLLSPLGRIISELTFIVFSSIFFLFSTVVLAKKLKVEPNYLYLLLLSTYVLMYGMQQGSELVAVSFIELAIAALITQNPVSGVYLAASALTRYNNITLIPLLTLNKNPKRIVKSLALYSLLWIPWLLYNRVRFGNMFTSIADGYALNVLYRTYIESHHSIVTILTVQNILLPLFLIGIVFELKRTFQKQNDSERTRANIAMAFIGFHAIYTYFTTPVAVDRYLFQLVLPTAYGAYRGLEYITRHLNHQRKTAMKIVIALFTISFILSTVLIVTTPPGILTRGVYNEVAQVLEDKGLQKCNLASNAWVLLAYKIGPVAPAPPQGLLEKKIAEGNIIVLFKDITEPGYVQERVLWENQPMHCETDKIVILGKGSEACRPRQAFTKSYLKKVQDEVKEQHEYELNINPCIILFNKHAILEKGCNLVNGHGFTQEENRIFT